MSEGMSGSERSASLRLGDVAEEIERVVQDEWDGVGYHEF